MGMGEQGQGRSTRSGRWEQLRASLWFLPAVVAAGSLLLTLGLLRIRPDPAGAVGELAWPASASSAATLLQLVATAVMTVTTLTLSLTIVALQLASQQFSPRLLRNFARDRRIQASLAVLTSAFVVPLTALRGIDPERPLPVLALALTWLLGLASVGVLLGFVAHLVRLLRVDTMMAGVHAETRRTIEQTYSPWGGREGEEPPEAPDDDALPGPSGGVLVLARRSGFVRSIDPGVLVAAAAGEGVFFRLGLRPGDHVVAGAPVGMAWTVDGGGPVRPDELADAVAPALDFGIERTSEQDAAFGFRQLVDIAVKAISPGINDPTTAAEAIGYCADLLVRLQGRRLGPQVKRDEEGRARVVLPDRDLRYYLDLACGQVRRFGRDMPGVLTALLRMLRDVAANARSDEQRDEVARQVALILDEVSDELVEYDLAEVREFARRVELALSGDLAAAYDDRAGETRSI